MKKVIIIAVIAIVVSLPVIIGSFLPKDRLVTEKAAVDKMYFFILADITNHWEEPSWRHNLDTMIQQPQIDGMDVWREYYTNGDSVTLMTQVTSETDYVRIIVDPDGRQRMRSILLVDVQGKTAIRMSEEITVKSPIRRFLNLFDDKSSEHIRLYLQDLVEKNKANPEEQQDSDGNW